MNTGSEVPATEMVEKVAGSAPRSDGGTRNPSQGQNSEKAAGVSNSAESASYIGRLQKEIDAVRESVFPCSELVLQCIDIYLTA